MSDGSTSAAASRSESASGTSQSRAGESLSRIGPVSTRALRPIAAALGILFGIVLAVWMVISTVPALRGTVVDTGETGDGVVLPDDTPALTRIRGRVLLEAVAEGEALRTDPNGPLSAPAPGTCRAIAWRDGRKLAAPVSCDAEGRFEVEVPGQPEGQVAVEMLVPGRLRAVLESPAPPGGVMQLATVALGLAATISGHVVDTRGQGVAGVEIAAMPAPNLNEPEPWRVTTDSSGAFVLDTVPPGQINLRARKLGYAESVMEAVAPEDGVVILLEGLRALTGEVIGPPELLARTRVRLEGSSIWPPIERAVDADGQFRFDEIPDGVYALDAAALAVSPGDIEYASIPLENVLAGTHVTLALIAARRVPVRVVNPEGVDVAGARVTLSYGSIGLLPRVDQTAADGRISLGPVVPGPYVIRADADDYLPAEPLGVDVRGDEDVAEQVLTLVQPAAISGRVIDESERGVANARVIVDSEALYSSGASSSRAATFTALMAAGSLGVTQGGVPPIPLFGNAVVDAVGVAEAAASTGAGAIETDADGAFTLPLLMPGVYKLRAIHGAYADSETRVFDLQPGQRQGGVVLTLREGVPLRGRVRDTNGRPIAHVRVELDDGTTLYTDSTGSFDAGRRRGAQRIVLRARGMIPQELELELQEDVEIPELELELAPADGALSGRVNDSNDRPITDVRVTLDPRGELAPTSVLWTDERGLFAFSGLAPGRAELALDHPDFAPAGKSVTVRSRGDDDFIELVLVAGWSLVVDVRAARTRDAIPGAAVEAAGRVLSTDDDGLARLSALAVDDVDIVVSADGYAPRRLAAERPPPGARAVVELRVELEDGGSITGVIVDDRGDPVVNARVEVRDRDSDALLGRARTRAGGVWRVDGLDEGDVIVRATPPPALSGLLAPVEIESDVLEGRVTHNADLRFERRP